jgi:hypothetical protein
MTEGTGEALGRSRRGLGLGRERGIAAASALLALLAGLLWFSTSTSDRGPTAALSADGFYYHAWLPTLVYDGDLDLADEYAVFDNFYCFGDAASGRPANPFGVGPALLELPFFLAGAVVAKLSGAELDGFSRPEVGATMLASLVATWAAMFFAWRLVRRRLATPWLALAAPLLVLAGGPFLYYAIRQPGYAHPFATLFAAWLVDFWDSTFDRDAPRTMRTWAALGALFGLAVLARTQLATWGFLLAIAVVDDLRRAVGVRSGGAGGAGARQLARSLIPAWFVGAGATLLAVAPQLLVWRALYGRFWLVPQGEGFLRWDSPAWSETLFSSRNGLFAYAPLLALAALGLVAGLRRAPRLAGALVAGVALQALANGAAWDWWAGGSFGGRRFDSCYVAFAFGLAALAAPVASAIRSASLRYVARAWSVALVLVAFALAGANLRLAAVTASHTARIGGGKPAPVVFREKLPRRLARLAGGASSAATWPARAMFALEHGVRAEAYDHVVGVHLLEERFPGLNCDPKPARQRLRLSSQPRRLAGLAKGPEGDVVVAGASARVLLGFNRYGPVELELGGIAPPAGSASVEVALRFDGVEIARDRIGAERSSIGGTARGLRRGVNVLEVEAPAGTRLRWLELAGPPTALGDRAAR